MFVEKKRNLDSWVLVIEHRVIVSLKNLSIFLIVSFCLLFLKVLIEIQTTNKQSLEKKTIDLKKYKKLKKSNNFCLNQTLEK
jgi:hypothetical protein